MSPEEAEWIERMFVCLAMAAEFGGRARSALGNLSDFAQRLRAQAPGQRATACIWSPKTRIATWLARRLKRRCVCRQIGEWLGSECASLDLKRTRDRGARRPRKGAAGLPADRVGSARRSAGRLEDAHRAWRGARRRDLPAVDDNGGESFGD
ncbi:MAG: hypothetical protein IPN78_07480 [Candidatus Accumulibacter sp.]|nr:hypothetical protein [Candidatus Accumulibacter propinquus]